MKRYNPKDIEPKWQKYWDENGTYVADFDSDKEPYYGFAMFNYPSGSSIHLGHAKNFTIPDILMRTKRQQGYESYSPVGFDSFGLPAENYAIKTGQSPRKTTDDAIASYRKQYRAMGWSMDWSKEIDSSQASYYRWTQWCFLQLHKAGLAYQKESSQWWCTIDKTVLADEQVINGKSWRHEGPDDPYVIKKNIKQWFFKITDYADDILAATDDLDWTPWVKTAQKNWIGRSEGATITFTLKGAQADEASIDVFTTAYDTIYGVTFMVIAPEHPLVKTYAQYAENAEDIEEYVQHAQRKSDIDREKNKSKTGVPFEGLTAVHPVTGEEIPVWIADYVLMGYGTGAIMAVPGEDERDYEFAQKYDLPIIYTTEQQEFISYQDIKAAPDSYKLAHSAQFDGMTFAEAKPKILDYIASAGYGKKEVNYKVRDWLISRQRYWGAPIPVVYVKDHGAVAVPESHLPVELPEVEEYQSKVDGKSALANVEDWVHIYYNMQTGDSVPFSSGMPDDGGDWHEAHRETDTMDGYVCSSWYQMRYLSPQDDTQAWDVDLAKKWMPVQFYNGGDHATAHLLYARFFTRFFYDQGMLDDPEPFKQMYFHAKILAEDGSFFSKTKGNGIDPLQVIDDGYGADALRTYIMFMAPPDVESPWSSAGLPSCYRFLNRIWTLAQEYLDAEHGKTEVQKSFDEDLLRATHKAIDKVTRDITAVKFNTAVSAMMECVNTMYKIKDQDSYLSDAWRFALESIIQLVAPFAPHIAEELWHDLGHEDSVHVDHWPVLDEKHLQEDTLTLAIQVNGKVRGEVTVPADADEATVQAAALAVENVEKHTNGAQPKKVIYVKGRLVSIVL